MDRLKQTMKQQRKSVFHVVSSLNLGGAERFVLDLCIAQRNNTWSPQIISFGDTSDVLVKEAISLDIPLTIIDKNLTKKHRLIGIIKLCLSQKRSVLHIHSPAALKQISPFLFLSQLKRHTVIYTRHGCAPLAAIKWRFIHQIARPFINKVTFVSDAGLEAFRIHYPWNNSKLQVIENGVLIPSEHPNPSLPFKTNRPFRLGSVGRIVPLKGQINLLRALAEIKSRQQHTPEVHFFGSGPEQDTLRDFVKEKQLDPWVFFHGTVMNRDEVYDSIDLLVVCSETEGLSLAIMESMARGIPVIATEVGGNPQLVKPEETGLLVPFNATTPLVKAISRVMGDPDMYKALAEKSRHFLRSKYSLDTTAQLYLKTYQSLKAKA